MGEFTNAVRTLARPLVGVTIGKGFFNEVGAPSSKAATGWNVEVLTFDGLEHQRLKVSLKMKMLMCA